MTPFNLVAGYHLCELTVAIYCLHFHLYPTYVLSRFHLRLLHPEIWVCIFLRNVAIPIPDRGKRNTILFISSYQINGFKINSAQNRAIVSDALRFISYD